MIGEFRVLISIYLKANNQHFIDAIESLKKQTLLPNEFVIIFDGPISIELESTVEEFSNWANENGSIDVNLVRLPINVGLGLALNRGLLSCKNEIIARFDADDICVNTRFEKQYDYFITHNVDVLGGFMEEFLNTPGDYSKLVKQPLEHSNIFKKSKYLNPISHPTVMFKKSEIVKHGSYLHMPLFEDYFLWIRLLNNGLKFANMNVVLVYFRVGDNMIGRRAGLNYFSKEFMFYKASLNLGYLNILQFLIIVCSKLLLRLLPSKVITFIYNKSVRTSI